MALVPCSIKSNPWIKSKPLAWYEDASLFVLCLLFQHYLQPLRPKYPEEPYLCYEFYASLTVRVPSARHHASTFIPNTIPSRLLLSFKTLLQSFLYKTLWVPFLGLGGKWVFHECWWVGKCIKWLKGRSWAKGERVKDEDSGAGRHVRSWAREVGLGMGKEGN